jgi:nitroreductase
MNDSLRKILEAGNAAPSGENCQPWRFKIVSDNAIDVYLYHSDDSVYNWENRGSYMAIGAAIENMAIEASGAGYASEVSYFPSGNNDHVARITLTQSTSTEGSAMASFITQRVTNRKPYEKRPLTKEQREALTAQANPPTRIGIIEDRALMQRLGRDGSTNEEVMLTNEHIHDFFFSHVSWTKEEDDVKRVGFYIKTLELPPPAKAIFKLLRVWSRAQVLNRLGLYKLIAAGNGATNASASAIGGILIDSTDPKTFVVAGRSLERLWLQATAMGLSFQPIAGMLFMKLCVDMGDRSKFTHANLEAIGRAYADATKIFDAGSDRLIFMFRIGYAKPPTARSSRFPLETALS